MYKVAHYSLYTRFLIKLSDCVTVITFLSLLTPCIPCPALLHDYCTASS